MARKLLLIDDQKEPAFLFGKGLISADEVETIAVARTVTEGMDKLCQQRWDVVFLDHDMGAECGTQVLENLSDRRQFMPGAGMPGEIIPISFNPDGQKRLMQMIEALYAGDANAH